MTSSQETSATICWTVEEEVCTGEWRRHATAHWWASKNDARQQLDDLMHANPGTTFRLVNSAGEVSRLRP